VVISGCIFILFFSVWALKGPRLDKSAAIAC
jgi:hypothetical protein